MSNSKKSQTSPSKIDIISKRRSSRHKQPVQVKQLISSFFNSESGLSKSNSVKNIPIQSKLTWWVSKFIFYNHDLKIYKEDRNCKSLFIFLLFVNRRLTLVKWPQNTYFVILVLIKVKTILLPISKDSNSLIVSLTLITKSSRRETSYWCPLFQPPSQE